MSVTLGSVLAAGVGAGVKGGFGLADSVVGYNLGKRDRRDAAKVDFEQYRKQRLFDYQYDSTLGLDLAHLYDNKDFDLARRYAENTASWDVAGLRKAGLNPILAANGGFNPSLGFQGSGPVSQSSGIPHSTGGSFRSRSDVDLLQSLYQAGSLDVQSSTATKLDADANVAQAQADNIKAQTLKTYVDAINDAHDMGGISKAPIHAITSMFGKANPNFGDLFSKYGLDNTPVASRAVSELASFIRSFVPNNRNSESHTAKERKVWLSQLSSAKDVANTVSPSPRPVVPVSKPVAPVKPSPRMLHEQRVAPVKHTKNRTR